MEFNPSPPPVAHEHETRGHTGTRDKSVGSTRRFPTLVAGAAVSALLFTGCGFGGGESVNTSTESGPPKPPGITDSLKRLQTDPVVSMGSDKDIDVFRLQSNFQKDDYKDFESRDPKTHERNVDATAPSVPLLEVQYDQRDKKLRFKDQTKNGIPEDALEPMLKAIADNGTVLDAAFSQGSIDRILIRQAEYQEEMAANNLANGYEVFISDDYSDSPSPKKTVFILLNGSSEFYSTQELTDSIRHETLHSFWSHNHLDLNLLPPSPADLARYNNTCLTLRDIATTQAESSAYKVLNELSTYRDLLSVKHPEMLPYINEVITAMENGVFSRMQPMQGEGAIAFTEKVPDCRAIGPYEAFVRLLNKHGLETPSSIQMPEDDITHTGDLLHDDYQQYLHQESIYKILTEATYNPDALATGYLGHPQDDWSELVTSSLDVMLAYPEDFGKNVAELPSEQKTLILGLLDKIVVDVGQGIEPSKSGSALRNLIATSHKTFRDAAAA